MKIGEYNFEIKEGMVQRDLESFFTHLRRLEVQEYEDDKGRKRMEERKASPERNGDYLRAGLRSKIMIIEIEGESLRFEDIDDLDPRVTVTMAGAWNEFLTELMTPIVPN